MCICGVCVGNGVGGGVGGGVGIDYNCEQAGVELCQLPVKL